MSPTRAGRAPAILLIGTVDTKSDDDHAIAEKYQDLITVWYHKSQRHDEL